MTAEEIERLQSAHAELKMRYADVMADGGSYRTLQVQLDAALQKHKDDAAAHEAALQAASDAWAKALAGREAVLAERHQAELEALKQEHAQAVKVLKESVLVPAVRDLHARQAADLAAQHKAQLDALVAD